MSPNELNIDLEKAQHEIIVNGYAYLCMTARLAKEKKVEYPKHLQEFGDFCGGFIINKYGERELNRRIKLFLQNSQKLTPSFEKQKIPNELWDSLIIATIVLMDIMPTEGIPPELVNEINQFLINKTEKFFNEINDKSEEWVRTVKEKKESPPKKDGFSILDSDIKIVVKGTKRSILLDNGEKYVIDFKKGEPLREDLSSVQDLVRNAIDTSLRNGDMIISLIIDGFDLVQDAIIKELEQVNMSTEDAFISVCQFAYMSNVDPSDVYDLINEVKSRLNSQ